MAKVVIICFFDEWALGTRAIANALSANGHEVEIIHFKLPSFKFEPRYRKNALNYQVAFSSSCYPKFKILQFHIDVNPWTDEEVNQLHALLKNIAPDIIGLSARSVYGKHLDRVLERIRELKGPVKIAGGHGPTYGAEYYLKYFDYACHGEGESALVEMADRIDRNEPLNDISNLVYIAKGRIVKNPVTRPTSNADYLFSPTYHDAAHHVIDNNKTLSNVDPYLRDCENQMFPQPNQYFTMMGRRCVFDCSFCSAGKFARLHDKLTESAFTVSRDVDDIIEELQFTKEQGFKFISFNDSFFLASRDHMINFFRRYKREIGLPFQAQLFPEQVLKDRSILEGAYEAGFRSCAIGVQSGSESVCKEIYNRATNNEKLIEFANLLTNYTDISVSYHFLTHNPFETDEDYKNTYSLISKLPKKNAVLQMGRLFPFIGTKIHQDIIEKKPQGVSDDEHCKRTLLSLLRFNIDDDSKFEEIQKKMKGMELQDAICFYEHEMTNQPLSDNCNYPVQFISSYDKYNIVLIGNKILGIDKTITLDSEEMGNPETIEKYKNKGQIIIGKSIGQIRLEIKNKQQPVQV